MMNEVQIDELRRMEKNHRHKCTMADWVAMRLVLNETRSPPPRDLETGKALIPETYAKLTLHDGNGKSMIVEIDWS